jgi:hypothetical protein
MNISSNNASNNNSDNGKASFRAEVKAHFEALVRQGLEPNDAAALALKIAAKIGAQPEAGDSRRSLFSPHTPRQVSIPVTSSKQFCFVYPRAIW